MNKEETTVNGVPVTSLSEAGQRLFDKVVVLKKEADDLAALYQLKQAGAFELEEMSKTEEDEGFKEKLVAKSQELTKVAQETLGQFQTKQAALSELSNMIVEEVNEIKAKQEAPATESSEVAPAE